MNGESITRKVVPAVITAGVIAIGSYWYSHMNAEASQGEITRTRIAVLEQKANESDRRAEEIREELRRVNSKLDRIWGKVNR